MCILKCRKIEKVLITICITGILVKVRAIKAADLFVFYREKHPQGFTQNCNHLHVYGEKHSRANPESGNDYWKTQMKHSKGLPNTQKTLVITMLLLPSPEAVTYLPRNVLTYTFRFFSCCFNAALHSLLYLSFSSFRDLSYCTAAPAGRQRLAKPYAGQCSH